MQSNADSKQVVSNGPLSGQFARPAVYRRDLPDGSFLLSSRNALEPFSVSIIDYLVKWGTECPGKIYLAERGNDGSWQFITYREALSKVRALAQFIVDHGASADRPVVTLSGNSITHALLHLACMYVGVPFSAISTSYSSIPDAFGKLKLCIDLLNPRVILVEQFAKRWGVLDRLALTDTIVLSTGECVGETTRFNDALLTKPETIDRLHEQIGPDTIAKYLFTSGSTGTPKAVINTNRMISSNQQQLVQIFPFLNRRPPVLVDWLPWSHTFGGNQTFFMTLRHGGTMYIDAGKPVEGAFATTIRNLREISPTAYFNVPKAFEMLVPELEADRSFCSHFFSELKLIYYAGASLPQRVWSALERLSMDVRGERVPIVTAWGTTETAPLATGVHFVSARADNIGVPVPGCEIKFAATGDRYELRVKGENVTPGYAGAPSVTAASFDEDGFFKTGDAATLADPSDPDKGIIFGGRVAEDFKLNSGTWVSVGTIKVNTLNALIPLATYVVVTGHDRDAIGLLLFVDEAAVERMSGTANSLNVGLKHPAVREFVQERLREYNKNARGSSATISRVLLLDSPPSIAANEITEKGYINQRAVMLHRAAEVEKLFSSSPEVIVVPRNNV